MSNSNRNGPWSEERKKAWYESRWGGKIKKKANSIRNNNIPDIPSIPVGTDIN